MAYTRRAFGLMQNRDLARRNKCELLYDRYKALRNQAQSLIRSAKSVYYNNMFSHADNAKDVWSELKRLGLIKTKDIKARLPHSVEELNKFFA